MAAKIRQPAAPSRRRRGHCFLYAFTLTVLAAAMAARGACAAELPYAASAPKRQKVYDPDGVDSDPDEEDIPISVLRRLRKVASAASAAAKVSCAAAEAASAASEVVEDAPDTAVAGASAAGAAADAAADVCFGAAAGAVGAAAAAAASAGGVDLPEYLGLIAQGVLLRLPAKTDARAWRQPRGTFKGDFAAFSEELSRDLRWESRFSTPSSVGDNVLKARDKTLPITFQHVCYDAATGSDDPRTPFGAFWLAYQSVFGMKDSLFAPAYFSCDAYTRDTSFGVELMRVRSDTGLSKVAPGYAPARGVMALRGGVPVGAAVYTGGVLFGKKELSVTHVKLHRLGTRAIARETGVGSALLAEVERFAASKGVLKINLEVTKDVYDDYTQTVYPAEDHTARLVRFYKRHGYKDGGGGAPGSHGTKAFFKSLACTVKRTLPSLTRRLSQRYQAAMENDCAKYA